MNSDPSAREGIYLVKPSEPYLARYREALMRGWSPVNSPVPDETVRLEQLAAIDNDFNAFFARLNDVEAKGPPVTLPDGTIVARIPCFHRWIFDGEDHFCGGITLRWQSGTAALPPHVLGHIGYAIVPWQRGKGRAKQALSLILDDARALGLPHVEICCRPDNIASKRTILACGGKPVGEADTPIDPGYGFEPQLYFRIAL